MAFSETEFRDIIHYLHAHPEAVAELRPLVLTEDVLNLPKLVAEIAVEVRLLVEQGRENDARLAEMKRETETLGQELKRETESLRQELKRETESLRQELQRESADVRQELDRVSAELKEEMAKLSAEVRGSVQRFDKHVGMHGNWDGGVNEERFIRNANNWFGQIIRKPRVADIYDIPEIGAAVESGAVTSAEVADLGLADAVFVGSVPSSGGTPLFAVCEFSVTIDDSDVSRARRRASVLERSGLNVVALVGGNYITSDASAHANSAGVRIQIHEPAK